MGLLTKIKEFFGQAAAETGIAEPQAPRLSDDLLAEPSAELPGRSAPADVVDIHRTDLPDEPARREFLDGPNFPDAAEPPERLH